METDALLKYDGSLLKWPMDPGDLDTTQLKIPRDGMAEDRIKYFTQKHPVNISL